MPNRRTKGKSGKVAQRRLWNRCRKLIERRQAISRRLREIDALLRNLDSPENCREARLAPCYTSCVNDLDQGAVCLDHWREFTPCPPDSKLGVAVRTLGQAPVHGLRHPPVGESNGWYIWAGEYSSDKDFFKPVHISHFIQRLPEVTRFLGLPPGSRFLLAGDHVDVWFDESLLNP
jgi:hypothetical protein